ncbi:MAG: tRNA (N(6)-L-threonylcarbamoyladenosine(37)-C(2))-methylthiotransferase MtaB [Acidobacteria bacterium]|nr:tRNA (N(6)-L-threonylcarbamoyladenosine(37)-C(2))-methylthiotransferase MtaB [Acidobacteriota bacterium]
MPKFFIQTFGCRCNQADSAAIREGLYRHSMSECGDASDADFIIVNTCTVTHRSDQQVRQAIRGLHRKNRSARIIVAGCYAERDPDALAALEGVDMVFGNAAREQLPVILNKRGRPDLPLIIQPPLDALSECPVHSMAQTGGKTRPLVKLQDGCDARCSYCIVPKVRGPGRSARAQDILLEIRALVDKGFQEIVLTGVHLGTYGRKKKGHIHLVDLLRRIVEIPGLGRIRLSSIEPMFFERSIVRLAAKSKVFAHHFHIPLQSGSDRILRRMRRPYKASRFRELVRFIHDEIPDAGIGTDVLAGFPGETEYDFLETLDLIKALPLAYLHVFPFSPREGTEACSMPDRVPAETLKKRQNILLELSRDKSLAFRSHFIGRTLPAITLSGEEERNFSTVLTGNYIHAIVPAHTVPPNRLVEVRIEEVKPDKTIARISRKVP